MNELELIFENISIDSLERLICQEIGINESEVISSHFYDEIKKKDIEINDLTSLSQHFLSTGTGNIFMREVNLGTCLENVMIIISFDELFGDVVLNFENIRIIEDDKYKKIIPHLLKIYDVCDIKEIVLGYEPATDEDMKILSIDKEGVHEGQMFPL